MIIHTSAGFGNPLPPEFIGPVLAISHGIRTGPAVNDTHEPIAEIVRNAAAYFATSTFLVGGWDWRRDDGTLYQRRGENLEPMKEHLGNQCRSILAEWHQAGRRYGDCVIEIGGELDGSFWKNHLDAFYRTAMHCYEAVREVSSEVPFVTGSTMNFNKARWPWQKSGYETLCAVCRKDWPADTWQGLHPYRTGLPPDRWPSWKSTKQAQDKLRKVLRGRKVAITEMGWHSNSGFSDEQIADFVGREVRSWLEFGATMYCHYQIQDGPRPDNSGEGGFGAYTAWLDGLEPKPVVAVLGEFVGKGRS